ncbi:cilia- and flagella-associated protein 36 isoform X2 [Ambystoma mexicanum]|uniref:cilia- and flagella-associated protein 36 isoform X2 n=1 Tax=Ambystoma mexicanum TaxID=8296 RepID=UPI0037E7F2F3
MTLVVIATNLAFSSILAAHNCKRRRVRGLFTHLPPNSSLEAESNIPASGAADMAEDSEWVVESIFGFLRSRLWAEPVLDFLEQRCSVFDDEEENKLSYTEIHHEYKKMVEKLLEGFLQEVGISEEQFQQACASPFAQAHSLQSILQPVMAAEDFKLFKSVMVQKNIELQLQAIQIIQERNGVLPDCLTNGSDVLSDLEQQEMELLSEAIRISKEEYEKEQIRKNFTKLCGVHLEPSETLQDGSSEKPLKDAKNRVSFEDENIAQLSGDHIKSVEVLRTVKPRTKMLEIPLEAPSLKLKGMSNAEAAEAWLEQARREAGIFGDKAEQLRKRAEYLKQKRDKLMSMKKETKNKLMKQNPEDQETRASPSKKEMTEEEKNNLQKRRHLAEKLKEEVINK